ncbi:MAG: NUDIX hydrolase, partial [Patescibacteria group bacterium]
VTILPIDKEGRILLNREYRPKYKKRVWRFPGGTIEKGESPKRAAQRELQEETGFKAKKLSLFYKSSLGQTIKWDRYVFLGEGLTSSKLPNDDTEDIQINFVTLSEAVNLVRRGEVGHDLTEHLILKLFLIKKRSS